MKHLKLYIQEGLKLGSSKINQYTEHPQTRDELRDIIEDRLREDEDADMNDIDVSEIEDMSGLFVMLNPHNIEIDQWDVSRVKDMSYMFSRCENFNADLSKWNVSRVTDMRSMFHNCRKFDCDLNDWNVSKVNNMSRIFYRSKLENHPPKWFKE